MSRRWALLFTVCAISFPFLRGQSYSYFPQIAVGGGWSCDFLINNQEFVDATSLRLSFFDDDGNPLSVTTDSGQGTNVDFDLAAGATEVIRVSSQGETQPGYAVLRRPAYASIRGTMVVRWVTGGHVGTQLGIPHSGAVTTVTFPGEINTATHVNTGVALANSVAGTTGDAVTCIVSLLKPDGSRLESRTLELAPGQHRSLFLDDPLLFPDLHEFVGTIQISGATPFEVVALRLEDLALGTLAISPGPVQPPWLAESSPEAEQEPNNALGQAQGITLPTKITGSFSHSGDVDFYRFSGSTGDIVSLMTECWLSGARTDTMLELQDAAGNILASNDESGILYVNDSFVQAVLPADGNYYVVVREYLDRSGADYDYRLHVSMLDGEGGGQQDETPQITSLTPSSANRGTSLQLSIDGASLTGATAVTFNPSADVTVSGLQIQASGSRVTVNVTIGASAATGARQVTVTTPQGTSNAKTFTITSPSGGSGYDGDWTGTTSQAKSFSFLIENNTLKQVRFEGTVYGGGCTIDFNQTTNLSITVQPWIDLTMGSTAPGQISVHVTGQFDSTGSASGSAEMTAHASYIPGVPSCSGTTAVTWSATKQ